MRTLSQLLHSLFCLQRSQREARAAAGAAQCKGEAPFNPTTTLNSQSGRGSTDEQTWTLSPITAPTCRAGGRGTHPSKQARLQLVVLGPRSPPVGKCWETPLRSFSPPPTALRLRLALTSSISLLPIITLLPHPPRTAWTHLNEAPSAPVSLCLILWAAATGNAWLCTYSLHLHYPWRSRELPKGSGSSASSHHRAQANPGLDWTNPERAFRRHTPGPGKIPSGLELLVQDMVGSGAFHVPWLPYSFLITSKAICFSQVMFSETTLAFLSNFQK